jgi:hypothetical protein
MLPTSMALYYNGLGVDSVSGFFPSRRENFVNFFYPWKLPATYSYGTWSHEGHYGSGSGDGGINNHQFTPQWTDVSVQAEASTNLAPAKPKRIENNTQPEVSEPFYPAEDRALY